MSLFPSTPDDQIEARLDYHLAVNNLLADARAERLSVREMAKMRGAYAVGLSPDGFVQHLLWRRLAA